MATYPHLEEQPPPDPRDLALRACIDALRRVQPMLALSPRRREFETVAVAAETALHAGCPRCAELKTEIANLRAGLDAANARFRIERSRRTRAGTPLGVGERWENQGLGTPEPGAGI